MKNYADHALANLIKDADKTHLGYVVKMGYDAVAVLTNDEWKQRCNGIPQNSFLIATSFDPANFEKANEHERIAVLLRVRGPKDLPQDADTFQAIIEHYQRKKQIQAPDELDGIELITHSRLQFSGLECHILGTFYTDNTGKLYMGSDIEDFYAIGGLRVYKPTAEALATIVNFIAPNRLAKAEKDAEKLLGSLPKAIPIGTVRYTSANPLQRAEKDQVAVEIQPLDFLARRTAVFGMTRTGKSNTVKTTVASVATVAKEAGVKVGQIIFDIKGEYANANGDDDGSSIAEALEQDVVRYGAHGRPGFEDLRNNFYESLEAGLYILQEALRAEPGTPPNDYRVFFDASFDRPDPNNTSEVKRWERNCAIYRVLLKEAGFPAGQNNKTISFPINDKVYDRHHEERLKSGCTACTNHADRVKHTKDTLQASFNAGFGHTGYIHLPIDDAVSLWKILRDIDREDVKNGGVGLESSSSKKDNPQPWLDPIGRALLNVMQAKNNAGGTFRAPGALYAVAGKQHSPRGLENVPKHVYENLLQGKVVILDLSFGNEKMKRIQADKIADYIFAQNMQKYTSGESEYAPIIMMYVEEAHNLIGKKAEIDSTWPRIAKEGAAFKIGLVFSTQEPSSIHPNIMANTGKLLRHPSEQR